MTGERSPERFLTDDLTEIAGASGKAESSQILGTTVMHWCYSSFRVENSERGIML